MFNVEFTKRAIKDFQKLDSSTQSRVLKSLNILAESPYTNPNVKKLTNREGYRLRVGDYRVIFEIKNKELIILVLETGHRKNIYH
ncbi:MAG: type II toxin-antitoxin system RelE/ParE family toxin [Rickettsiales bacterium]|nr:type II toxin-antitoxin system RelE/ParE family toxin [Rickettsiales bacterium]